ncbi:amino acid-binding protein [Erwiniaceae bacterium CAU 1747]
MHDIHILLRNAPGELASMASLLGQNGIGLEGGGVFTTDAQAHAHFLVEDGIRAREVLETAGFPVVSVSTPLIRKLRQKRPGELGEIATTLASHGISILVQYSDHANRLILLTDDDKVAATVTEKWTVNRD